MFPGKAIGINRSLVQSAEDTVFYSDAQGWVTTFIEKNRDYHMETQEVSSGTGPLKHYRQIATKFDRAARAKEQVKAAAPISADMAISKDMVVNGPNGAVPKKGMTFSTSAERSEQKPLD